MGTGTVAIIVAVALVAVFTAYKIGRKKGSNRAWDHCKNYDIPLAERCARDDAKRDAWSSLEKSLWRVRDLTHNMPREWGVPMGSLSPDQADYIRHILEILPFHVKYLLTGRCGITSPPCVDIPRGLVDAYPGVFTPEVVAKIGSGDYEQALRAEREMFEVQREDSKREASCQAASN